MGNYWDGERELMGGINGMRRGKNGKKIGGEMVKKWGKNGWDEEGKKTGKKMEKCREGMDGMRERKKGGKPGKIGKKIGMRRGKNGEKSGKKEKKIIRIKARKNRDEKGGKKTGKNGEQVGIKWE